MTVGELILGGLGMIDFVSEAVPPGAWYSTPVYVF